MALGRSDQMGFTIALLLTTGITALGSVAGAEEAPAPAAPAPGAGSRCEIETTADPGVDFVARLVERYAAFRKASLDGNLMAYRNTRTASIVEKMESHLHNLSKLSHMGQMLHDRETERLPLSAYEFVQASQCGMRARLAYRRTEGDYYQFLIVMFEHEDELWKVGSTRRAHLDAKMLGGRLPSIEAELGYEDVQLR